MRPLEIAHKAPQAEARRENKECCTRLGEGEEEEGHLSRHTDVVHAQGQHRDAQQEGCAGPSNLARVNLGKRLAEVDSQRHADQLCEGDSEFRDLLLAQPVISLREAQSLRRHGLDEEVEALYKHCYGADPVYNDADCVDSADLLVVL